MTRVITESAIVELTIYRYRNDTDKNKDSWHESPDIDIQCG